MRLSILLFSLAVLISACNTHPKDKDNNNSQSSCFQEATSYNRGYSDINGQQTFDLTDNKMVVEEDEEEYEETNIEDEQSSLPTNITVSDLNGNTIHYTIDQFGNASGYDSNGNDYHSTTDNFGNTDGYDNNGNYYHYHTDDFGNINGYDNKGNSITAHISSY